MREPTRIPTARDLMTKRLLTFRPEQTVLEAMGLLLRWQVSGAPVVDASGQLVGVLSELDCLRLLASDGFYVEFEEESALVADYMTRGGRAIPPDLGIYAMAHYFVTGPIRRLPVVEQGELIGQVSRRDVLRGLDALSRRRLIRKRFPDYLAPSEASGPRRARL